MIGDGIGPIDFQQLHKICPTCGCLSMKTRKNSLFWECEFCHNIIYFNTRTCEIKTVLPKKFDIPVRSAKFDDSTVLEGLDDYRWGYYKYNCYWCKKQCKLEEYILNNDNTYICPFCSCQVDGRVLNYSFE
jgi:hypothetical protein